MATQVKLLEAMGDRCPKWYEQSGIKGPVENQFVADLGVSIATWLPKEHVDFHKRISIKSKESEDLIKLFDKTYAVIHNTFKKDKPFDEDTINFLSRRSEMSQSKEKRKKATAKKTVTKKATSKKKVTKKTVAKKKGRTKVDELKAMFEKKGVGHTIEAIAKKFNTHNKGASMVIFLAKKAKPALVLVRKEDNKYYVK